MNSPLKDAYLMGDATLDEIRITLLPTYIADAISWKVFNHIKQNNVNSWEDLKDYLIRIFNISLTYSFIDLEKFISRFNLSKDNFYSFISALEKLFWKMNTPLSTTDHVIVSKCMEVSKDRLKDVINLLPLQGKYSNGKRPSVNDVMDALRTIFVDQEVIYSDITGRESVSSPPTPETFATPKVPAKRGRANPAAQPPDQTMDNLANQFRDTKFFPTRMFTCVYCEAPGHKKINCKYLQQHALKKLVTLMTEDSLETTMETYFPLTQVVEE
jgi:hypothetical protein